MARLKDLKVTIGLSKKGLTKLNADLRRTQANFKRNFGEIQSMVSGVGRGMTAALTVPLVGIGAAAVKSAAQLESMETSFISLTGGAQQAADMMANLNEFTAQTPFQIEGVAKAARQLIASGSGVEDVNQQLQFLGDIAATSGVSIEEIAAIFAKVNAKGKVELENLNQLAERGIPIFEALAEATGLPADSLGAGAVSVSEFNAVLESFSQEGGFAAGAMERLSQTAAGKFSTALDNLKQAGAELAKGLMPTISKIIDRVTSLAQGFAGLSQETKNLILVIGMGAAALGPALIAASSLMTSFAAVTTAMGISVTAALGPIGLLVTAIGVTLAGAFAIMASAEKRSRKRLEGLDKTVQELYGNIEKGSQEAARSVAVIDSVFERLDTDDVIDLGKANGELKKRLSALRSESLKTAQQMYRQGKITDINAEATARFRLGLGELRSEFHALVHVVKEETDATEDSAKANELSKEAFIRQLEKAAALREEKERLADATRTYVGTIEDEKEAQEALRERLVAFTGTIKEVAMEEEELLDEDITDRIKEGTKLITNINNAAQHMGSAFNTASGLVGAAFDNIRDKSQGFHVYLKKMLTDLLQKAIALAAAFAAMSLIMGPTVMAKAGFGSFGKFMMAGFGIPQMAEGGLFTGASLAMVGEGPGTSLANPEVVAPLDKLQQMMGGGNVTVTGRLDGRDILISSERAGFDRNRVRGF